MGGYQFLHIASFSRKADAEGRTIDFVLAEAARRADACQHVGAPAPPEIIFGQSVDDVRILHDTRLGEARTTNRDGKTRKLRVDQHTLLTAVLSHPATVAEMRNNPAVAAAVRAWEERSVTWLRATWGDAVVSVIRHVDEAHCHLHALILPDGPEMRARLLHPGIAAKDRAKETVLAEGADAKTANARGDAAYKSALRAMQDEFWRGVGLPSGLARLGPGRRRLSRAAWRAEQAAAVATADSLRIAGEAKNAAETATRKAVAVRESAEARVSAATDLESRAQAAAKRASVVAAAARESAAEAQARAAAAEARRSEAERQACAVSVQARAEARRVVGAAQHEASQVVRGARRVGTWLAALWHGLQGAHPALVSRRAAEQAREQERQAAQELVHAARAEADRSRSLVRAAEQRLAAVSAAAASLGRQRDTLAAELGKVRVPSPEVSPVRRFVPRLMEANMFRYLTAPMFPRPTPATTFWSDG